MKKTPEKTLFCRRLLPSIVFAISTSLSGCAEMVEPNMDGHDETTKEKVGATMWFVGSLALMLSSPGAASDGPSTETPPPEPTPPPPAPDTFAARNTAMGNTYTRTQYRIGPGTPSPGANAGASGTAVYEGHANIKTDRFSADSFAIGKARIEADFSQNTISGRIDQFLDPADAPLTGTITLSNGTITRTDKTATPYQDDRISANLAGDLDVGGTNTQVSGTIAGGFREGQEPEPISPAGAGYITGNINMTTLSLLPLYGGFTVTRQ